MKKNIYTTLFFIAFLSVSAGLTSLFAADNTVTQYEGWDLVWHDEFDVDGPPNSKVWSYEEGFVRNEELQWYQKGNAVCENGLLKITGRIQRVENPNYNPNATGGNAWKETRPYAEYTSSSINTLGKQNWLYGRFEIRAKIPTAKGSWPGIWTVGVAKEWPDGGEIDIMEYYLKNGAPHILANLAWGSGVRWVPKWNSKSYPLSSFTKEDPDWANKFHIWRMDWDEDYIKIYLDDKLMNSVDLSTTYNPDGFNPFRREQQYFLLNLAIGSNGGTPDDEAFPLVYEVDYVRVYQQKTGSGLTNSSKKNSTVVRFNKEKNKFQIKSDNNLVNKNVQVSIYCLSGICLCQANRIAEKEFDIYLANPLKPGVYIVQIVNGQTGRNTYKTVVY